MGRNVNILLINTNHYLFAIYTQISVADLRMTPPFMYL